ncbi:MAG: hypothetical protein LBC68_07725 [Prevotellaceae bacterium]|jgi:hypothetical protein|nr:hypothetical protein [Prevotellaceae bacterium]
MEATKEQIAGWKAKHGDIFCIKVEDKCCYLKKPSRKTLGYASMAGKENPLKFNEILLNDCWIAGDEEIKTNDDLFLSVSSRIGEIIEMKETELVKL